MLSGERQESHLKARGRSAKMKPEARHQFSGGLGTAYQIGSGSISQGCDGAVRYVSYRHTSMRSGFACAERRDANLRWRRDVMGIGGLFWIGGVGGNEAAEMLVR